jgi:hypothetical protein
MRMLKPIHPTIDPVEEIIEQMDVAMIRAAKEDATNPMQWDEQFGGPVGQAIKPLIFWEVWDYYHGDDFMGDPDVYTAIKSVL